MDPGISALVVVGILVASALIFTFVFIFVADRKLAEASETGRYERERLNRENAGKKNAGGNGAKNGDDRVG